MSVQLEAFTPNTYRHSYFVLNLYTLTSGVTSRMENPVPPVVRIRSSFRLSLQMHSLSWIDKHHHFMMVNVSPLCVCVCLCVHVCVCIPTMCVCMRVHYICAHAQMHACMCVCVCVSVYACICVWQNLQNCTVYTPAAVLTHRMYTIHWNQKNEHCDNSHHSPSPYLDGLLLIWHNVLCHHLCHKPVMVRKRTMLSLVRHQVTKEHHFAHIHIHTHTSPWSIPSCYFCLYGWSISVT